MSNLIIQGITMDDFLSKVREMFREENLIKQKKEEGEKLLSPAEAVKLFKPKISKVTLAKWTSDGRLQVQRIGGRLFYRHGEILSAGCSLKKYKRS
jgi:hypothetical protein